MNTSESESVLQGSAPEAAPVSTGSPDASSPVTAPDPQDGIWTALARHLDAGNYRPERSPAVITVPMTTRHGDAYYVLANRDRSQYARLSPEEFYLWRLMDGTQTVRDLILEYFNKFNSLAFDAVAQLVAQLRRQFMLADLPQDVFASLRRTLAPRGASAISSAVWQVMTGQRAFQIHHIDALMGTLHRRVAWILYTRPMQVLYVILSVVGTILFLRQFASHMFNLFAVNGSYGQGFLLLAGLNFVSVVVHEASHALTCKHYGGHVHRAGLMIYFGFPAAFVDTTDIWTKPAPARMATTWAGPYSGLVLAGLLSVIVQVAPGFWAASIFHKLAFLWLTTFLFNVIPFLELDGYYLVVDWLEMPLLRSRALRFFRTELWDRLRHHQRLTGQERLLSWFGGMSFLFSGLVLFSALLGWKFRFNDVAATLWAGGLGSKALLVLLILLLGFPLAVRAVAPLTAAVAHVATWIRRLMTPRGHRLREREGLLRQVPCLAPLSDEEAAKISIAMSHDHFWPGRIIVQEGMEADRFYILERGVAEMWVDGETAPRRRLGRGDYFGETALLDREPYAATIRARSWCSLFSLARSEFDRWVGPHICSQIDQRLYTIQALRRLPNFAGLPPRQLDALAAVVERRQFDAGDLVSTQGEQANAVSFVEAGQAEGIAGEERRILGPGDHFGDAALTSDAPHAETVRALTVLELFEFPRAQLEAALAGSLGGMSGDLPHAVREGLQRACCFAHAAPQGP